MHFPSNALILFGLVATTYFLQAEKPTATTSMKGDSKISTQVIFTPDASALIWSNTLEESPGLEAALNYMFRHVLSATKSCQAENDPTKAAFERIRRRLLEVPITEDHGPLARIPIDERWDATRIKQTPEDYYFQAWLFAKESPDDNEETRTNNLAKALEILQDIKAHAPDWKSDLVKWKMEQIQEEIQKGNPPDHQP